MGESKRRTEKEKRERDRKEKGIRISKSTNANQLVKAKHAIKRRGIN